MAFVGFCGAEIQDFRVKVGLGIGYDRFCSAF